MYPAGAVETTIAAGHIGTLYEGASRPGHFDGMLTVVVEAAQHRASRCRVFGQKDAQQVFLVRRMVASSTCRPSSRSCRRCARPTDSPSRVATGGSTPSQRAAALTLTEALRAAEAAAADGLAEVLAEGAAAFGDHDDVTLDYLVVVDPETFLPVADDARGPAVVLVAARVGSTRLIDNAAITLG